jgi:hypothetical protein
MTVLDSYASVSGCAVVIEVSDDWTDPCTATRYDSAGQTWKNLNGYYTLAYGTMKLKRVGSPTGNYRYAIFLRAAGGLPTGSALDWTAWNAVSGISGSKFVSYRKAYTQLFIVDPLLWYCQVLQCDGSLDYSNAIDVCSDDDGSHAGTGIGRSNCNWFSYGTLDSDFSVEGTLYVPPAAVETRGDGLTFWSEQGPAAKKKL